MNRRAWCILLLQLFLLLFLAGSVPAQTENKPIRLVHKQEIRCDGERNP